MKPDGKPAKVESVEPAGRFEKPQPAPWDAERSKKMKNGRRAEFAVRIAAGMVAGTKLGKPSADTIETIVDASIAIADRILSKIEEI